MTPREEWQLNTLRLGRRVLVFDQIASTNTYAASLAQDAGNDGVVVLADEQTAGRGQQGRCWHSPPRTAILMSVLVFPPPELRRPVILVAWAANSVCEAIRRATGLEAAIKWPNDVLIHGRKVCGILIEQARGTVVGIGLNVNQTAESLAEAGLPEAGALAQFIDKALDRQEIARLLIAELDEEYERLHQGDLATLETAWRNRTGLLGKQVLAQCHGGCYRGRLCALTWQGLHLETTRGELFRVRPEQVQHLMRV